MFTVIRTKALQTGWPGLTKTLELRADKAEQRHWWIIFHHQIYVGMVRSASASVCTARRGSMAHAQNNEGLG